MNKNRKTGDRLANQTGSQSGNPRNQQIQREQEKGGNVQKAGRQFRNEPDKNSGDVASEGNKRNK